MMWVLFLVMAGVGGWIASRPCWGRVGWAVLFAAFYPLGSGMLNNTSAPSIVSRTVLEMGYVPLLTLPWMFVAVALGVAIGRRGDKARSGRFWGGVVGAVATVVIFWMTTEFSNGILPVNDQTVLVGHVGGAALAMVVYTTLIGANRRPRATP